jgi:hypothetical protein
MKEKKMVALGMKKAELSVDLRAFVSAGLWVAL